MMNRKRALSLAALIIIICVALAYAFLTSTNNQITEPVLDGGGDTLASAGHIFQTSVGQVGVDTASSAGYAFRPGLFYMRLGITASATRGDSLIVVSGNHQVIANGETATFVIDVKDSGTCGPISNARVDFMVEYEGTAVGTTETAASDAAGRVSKSIVLASGDGFYLVTATPAAAPNQKTQLAVYTNQRKILVSTDTNKKWTMFAPFAKPVAGVNGIGVNGVAGVGSLIIYRWDPKATPDAAFQQYLSVSGQASPNNSTVGTFSDFIAGRAYFALSKGADATVGLSAGSTASDSPYQILVHPGWNMIGNPFQHYIDWTVDVRLDTDASDTMLSKSVQMSNLDANSYHTKIYWRKESAGGGYVFGPATGSISTALTTFDTTVQMKPWSGFWMKIPDAAPGCATGCTLAFYPNKRLPQTTNVKMQAPTYREGTGTVDQWIIPLKATGPNGAVDDYNYVGVAPGAREGRDGYDAYKAPAIGDFVQVGIRELAGNPQSPLLAASLIPQISTTAAWDVVVSAGASWPVTLAWDAGAIPNDYGAYLIGGPEGVVDLRKKSSTVVQLNSEATLTLVVRTPEYLSAFLSAPLSKENTFVYPNPGPDASGNMTFKYNLQSASGVKLKIFDVGGKPVKELAQSGSAGSNGLTWDTTNKNGQKLGTGVYIYILESGGVKLVDKLAITR